MHFELDIIEILNADSTTIVLLIAFSWNDSLCSLVFDFLWGLKKNTELFPQSYNLPFI